jgi:hypothetical protein
MLTERLIRLRQIHERLDLRVDVSLFLESFRSLLTAGCCFGKRSPLKSRLRSFLLTLMRRRQGAMRIGNEESSNCDGTARPTPTSNLQDLLSFRHLAHIVYPNRQSWHR